MTEAELLRCTTCGGETLHSVVRNGRGDVINSVCKDPGHARRSAESAILKALGKGSIQAADIAEHPELRGHHRQAINQAVTHLEAAGRVIVLRETGDREHSFPFSGLMLAEG